MEHQDEIFESIPWDRLGSLDRSVERRRWAMVAVGVALVGATAFAVRRVPTPVVAAPLPSPVTTTTLPEPVVVPETDLWAAVPSIDRERLAERFALEWFTSSGVDVLGVAARAPAVGGVVDVVATLGAATGVDVVALAVEVGDDGEIVRWWPAVAEPLDVRVPVAGAEPPPEILAEFTRMAARWGTTIEVVASGLSEDRWWADVLVRLPSGSELRVMVWEDS